MNKTSNRSNDQLNSTRTGVRLPIRILTHNIRYATTDLFEGEAPWPMRLPLMISEFRYHTAFIPTAFICLQEVLHCQLLDILSAMNQSCSTADTEWAHIGIGRDDGAEAGEYSPILYRPSAWTLLDSNTIWLSETPNIPSKGWDAASKRILTMGLFASVETGRPVAVFNTHLDDQGEQSRIKAAEIISRQADKVLRDPLGPVPLLLSGDLNSEINDTAYRELNAATSSIQDLADFIPEQEQYGHRKTYTGFGHEGERQRRIDFIFLGPREQISRIDSHGSTWTAQNHAVLESRFEDGTYSSDHRAVVGDLSLKV